MNRSALARTALLLLTALAGLLPTVLLAQSNGAPAQDSLGTPQADAANPTNTPFLTERLATLRLQVMRVDDALEVKAESSTLKRIATQTLATPPRIVVDLHGVDVPTNRAFSLGTAPYLAALRVGKHPQMTRLVLDAYGDSLPSFSVREPAGGTVVIRLGPPAADLINDTDAAGEASSTDTATDAASSSPSELPPSAVPHEAPSAAASAQPSMPNTPSLLRAERLPTDTHPTPTVEPQGEPGPTAAPLTLRAPHTSGPLPPSSSEGLDAARRATPTSDTASAAPPEMSGSPVLQRISFEVLESNGPALRLDLSRRTPYRLARKDARTFELRIEEGILGAQKLSLPHFPPAEHAGFTMARARHSDGSLVVDLTVERGVRLSASSVGDDIIIRPLLP